MTRLLLLFVFISSGLSYGRALSEKKRLTQSIAQIQDEALTSRQFQISRMVDAALHAGLDSQNMIIDTLNPEKRSKVGFSQQEILNFAIEHAIYREAGNFSVKGATDEEIKKLISAVKGNLVHKEEWKALNVTESELEAEVKRKALVSNFLRFRVKSMVSIVTEQDVKKYYDSNPSKFAQVPFEKIKKDLRDYLIETQSQEQLRAWFDVLKRKYHLQVLGPF